MPVVVDDQASVASSAAFFASRRASPAKNWSGTWNNYPDNWKELILAAFRDAKVIVAQQETGEEGTKHLQFCVEFTTKKRAFSLGFFWIIHWENTKNKLAARRYCSKEDTRDEGTIPFIYGWRPPRSLGLITLEQMYPWQR